MKFTLLLFVSLAAFAADEKAVAPKENSEVTALKTQIQALQSENEWLKLDIVNYRFRVAQVEAQTVRKDFEELRAAKCQREGIELAQCNMDVDRRTVSRVPAQPAPANGSK